MADRKGIHAIQIANRPPRAWAQTVHAILYFVVFNFGCIMINVLQFAFLLPLRFLPLLSLNSLYGTGIRLSKGAFGTLLSKSLGPPPLAYHSPVAHATSSPHVSMVRTFVSHHNIRTRRAWRLLYR